LKYLKEAIALGRLIFKGVEQKHLQLVAAGLAYYFLMSLFPALVLLTAFAAYLPMGNGAQGAVSFVAHMIPQQSLSAIKPLLDSITPHRTELLWLGIVSTLWLTSVGANAIIAGLDLVYEVNTPRSLWMNRFIAFGLTLAVGILLLLAIALTLTGPVLEWILETVVPVQNIWIRLWPYVQWLLAGTFTFAAIELLYVLAPNVPVGKRTTIPGALVAAASWLLLSWGLSFYFHEIGEWKLKALYGVFATPIALLIWLKSSAGAILVGAQLNVSLQSRKLSRRSDPYNRMEAA
jgi:membrane protein